MGAPKASRFDIGGPETRRYHLVGSRRGFGARRFNDFDPHGVLFRSIRGEYAAKELKNRAWRVCDGVEHFGFGGEGRGEKQPGRESKSNPVQHWEPRR